RPNFAIFLFIGGLVITPFWVLNITEVAEVAYSFCVVIIFGGVIVSRKQLIGLVGGIIIMILHLPMITPSFTLTDFTLPIILLSLTTLATWVSTYNLQVAIEWTFNGYEQARKKEIIVRQQKIELLHTMQSLNAAVQQLQETNQRLQQARYQAEEARRVKQNFAQTISHELRTPLNLIVGFTETMVKSPEYYGEPLLPPYLRDLTIVYRNAYHLQNMVNDVLDLARLEKATMELVPKPIDVAIIIQDGLEIIGDLIRQRGLALHTHLAPHLPLAFGDAVRLKQVLLNLLNNAASFTEKGSITVHATHADESVVICVEDTGAGIDQAQLDDIFEPFRQLDAPMKRNHNGTGLGLAISKHLMELQGGNIWVESTIGVGSRFYFDIPVFKNQPELNHSLALNIQEKQHQFGVDAYLIKPVSRESLWGALETLPAQHYKVLVVDDNQDFVRLMYRFLMMLPRPYQMVGAANATEAMALIRFHQPDIILIDLHLPDMQGHTLIDAVRACLPPKSHIIIVSAYEELDEFANIKADDREAM
ncbi:MAG TPA: ATP-binding protein, partial [Aggregatilineales bacterium]|nr:ATP-binding protein [Aggregatilineales bacterium]